MTKIKRIDYKAKATGEWAGALVEFPTPKGATHRVFDFGPDPKAALETLLAAKNGEQFQDNEGRTLEGDQFIDVLMSANRWTYGELRHVSERRHFARGQGRTQGRTL